MAEMLRRNFVNVVFKRQQPFPLSQVLLAFATGKFLLRQDQKFREKFEQAYPWRELSGFKVK